MVNLDRVRPRQPEANAPAASLSHDPQGKRSLFSAASPPAQDRPGVGSVSIECSGCGERSIVSPIQAMRAAFPSVILALNVAHGEEVTTIGVTGREHAVWLRCPACRRRRWAKVSLTL